MNAAINIVRLSVSEPPVANDNRFGIVACSESDPAGHILTITYPSGRLVTYTRDALGRVSGITTKQNSGSPVVTVASSAGYEPFGPLTALTFGNGLVLAASWDQDYQISGIVTAAGATTIQNLSYAPDPAGNILSITDNLTPARTQAFTYDDLNRLLTASGLYPAQS
jgi:YD repeat-containing protein